MTVLGDLAQATGPHTHLSWDPLGTLLSDYGDWRVAELNTSYRVPAEIMDFVAPLARAVAPGLPYPEAVRRAGEDAVRTVATEPWKLLDDTVAQMTRLVGTSDGSTPRSVAVIVPDDSSWLDEISRRLDEDPGLDDTSREAVSVLAAAQAKGMEYDHVLVVEPATIADRGPAGRRQLYIALTRSTQTLTVLHTSPLPEVLTNRENTPQEPSAETNADANPGHVPEIGADIRVRVVGPGPGGRYKVKAIRPHTGRPLVLTVRHGSTPPRRGEELDCWVFANETGQSVLTADGRGRMPVSPRMAQRYMDALGVLDALVTGDDGVLDDARARLSDLHGMANRILRRDQADWVDVYRVLRSPDRQRLGVLRDLASRTNRALKDGTLDTGRLGTELAESGWSAALADAQQTLRARLADTKIPDHSTEPDAHQPGHSEQKEAEPVTTVDNAPAVPAVTTKDDFLAGLETLAASDRTCKKHEAVRHALKSELLWVDLQPTDSDIVDVLCTVGGVPFLYEVLGAGRSAYAELRSGATRLLEINHTLSTPAARLHLVLCEPPAEAWAAETVREAFGIHVLWRTRDGWGGDDPDTALSTQQE